MSRVHKIIKDHHNFYHSDSVPVQCSHRPQLVLIYTTTPSLLLPSSRASVDCPAATRQSRDREGTRPFSSLFFFYVDFREGSLRASFTVHYTGFVSCQTKELKPVTLSPRLLPVFGSDWKANERKFYCLVLRRKLKNLGKCWFGCSQRH